MKRILISLILLTLVAAAGTDPRIVAIADVHGAYDSFVGILQKSGLLDAKLKWSGNNSILVQTGDYTDRGPKSRAVMNLLMQLEEKSKKQGGQVHVLLGNHEVMNMIGDLRYVSTEEYASYSDAKSLKRQQEAYRQYVEFQKEKAMTRQIDPVIESEEEWQKTHPVGYVEHRQAFSPEGKYGQWLRKRPTVLRIRTILFVHGGLSEELAGTDPGTINQRIRDEIDVFDRCKQYLISQKLILPAFTLDEVIEATKERADLLKAKEASQLDESEQAILKMLETVLAYGGWWSVHPDGPLWFRGYAKWTDEEGAAKIDSILKAAGVTRIVVGHSVLEGSKILPRFGGKVFLIDTGMLGGTYYPKGRPSAFQIEGDNFTAIYIDEKNEL